jgi:threonine/homoserine/homoserine lactone efflux protein
VNLELFLAFLVITLVLIITPGPIVTLVVATGATEGIRAALMTVVGTVLGNALLVGAIAFSLTWIINSSVVLFDVIRWAGAAYLIWLGIQMWRHAGTTVAVEPLHNGVHFGRGFLVALSNPKTIAFFTAFLPQFVDPRLPAEFQLAVMCAVSVLMATVTDSGWAIASGLGRAWFVRPARAKLLGRFSGALLVGGGIWLSLSRRPA